MTRTDTLDSLLAHLSGRDGAVLHLCAGAAPCLRQRGALLSLPDCDGPLSDEALRELLRAGVPAERWADLAQAGHARLVYRSGEARYALCLYDQVGQGGPGGGLWATARLLPAEAPAALGLPPALRARAQGARGGLLLCAGPAAAGVSLALAALLDAVDEGAPRQVVALEAAAGPVPRGRRSLLVQRELVPGADLAAAVATALRQGADVLVVDPLGPQAPLSGVAEGLDLLLRAAEGGVLVLGALRAPGGAEAIDLLGRTLSPADVAAGRRRVGRALRALLALRLCPGTDGAQVAASELLLGGPALAEAAAAGAVEGYLAQGRHEGMQTLDDSLAALVEAGRLGAEDAYLFARDKDRFPAPF